MRSLTGTGLVVAALIATAAALLFPILSFAGFSAAGTDINAGTVATRFGPLSPVDRDFVSKVRLAGLWELPAGQQAEERGTTKAVRTAGEHLVTGHTALDRHVRQVGAQLGVDLPNQPNDQQRGWLSELEAARGADYDRKFANILRLAHGRVFTLVAQVRATTRNSLVRGLADDANTTVLDHITVLERTGNVDFDGIARDTSPSGSPTPQATPPGATPPPAQPAPADPSAPPAAPEPGAPSATYPLPPAASAPAPQDRGNGNGEGRGNGEDRREGQNQGGSQDDGGQNGGAGRGAGQENREGRSAHAQGKG